MQLPCCYHALQLPCGYHAVQLPYHHAVQLSYCIHTMWLSYRHAAQLSYCIYTMLHICRLLLSATLNYHQLPSITLSCLNCPLPQLSSAALKLELEL